MLKQWLEYLEEQVGRSVYVWGAQGQRADGVGDVQEWIRDRSRTNVMAGRAWRFYQEMEKKIGQENITFFDCSGLAMYFFQNLNGIAENDTTANGLWRGCTSLSKGELQPGDFVFRQSEGKMSHIGYVAADGNIIEARASGYGVEKRALSEGKWTHFGRHKWIIEALAEDAAKKDPKKEKRSVKAWQEMLLQYDPECLPRFGADGKYGKETDTAVKKLIGELEALRKERGYGG